MNRLLGVALLFAAALCAADATAEKEVLAAMEEWRLARINKSGAVLERLYAPDLTYMHSTGKLENKREGIDAIVHGKDKVESLDYSGMDIRVYGNIATARVQVTLRTNTEGQITTLILATLHVWARNTTGWQLVARQATRLNP